MSNRATSLSLLLWVMLILITPTSGISFTLETSQGSVEIDLQIGDALLWRPVVVDPAIEIHPAEFYEFNCLNIETFYYHMDVIVDPKTGIIATSTPHDGAGDTSTIQSRVDSGDWTRVAIVRNPDFNLEEAIQRAEHIKGLPYSWIGYWTHILDLTPPLCSILPIARLVLLLMSEEWLGYHCVSYTSYVLGLEWPHPHFVTPFGIMSDIHSGCSEWEWCNWEIVGEYDL